MTSAQHSSGEMILRGRLPWFHPHDLTAEQQQVYDGITTGPRASAGALVPMTDPEGRLEGPFNAMLVNPQVGNALQALGARIRYATGLTGRQREIAVLVAAVAARSDFEVLAHEALGRAAGLTDDELASLRDGERPATLDEPEALLFDVVRSLVDHRDVDDELFAAAAGVLGTTTIVELVVLVGYYQTLALSLRTFRVPLPDGAATA